MSPAALIIAGIAQLSIVPALMLGRRGIVDWLSSNVPALDVAWFHVCGTQLMIFGGIAGVISGGAFIVMGTASLAHA